MKDKDGDLWMCNANAEGAVFTNVFMQGDLLKGDGASLIGSQRADRRPTRPARRALCAAVGSHIEDMQVVATVDDGLGDYLTWLKNGDDDLWICNASADAKLYDFEPVDLPLNDVTPSTSATPDDCFRRREERLRSPAERPPGTRRAVSLLPPPTPACRAWRTKCAWHWNYCHRGHEVAALGVREIAPDAANAHLVPPPIPALRTALCAHADQACIARYARRSKA